MWKNDQMLFFLSNPDSNICLLVCSVLITELTGKLGRASVLNLRYFISKIKVSSNFLKNI